jgi:hypothetical protein
MHWHPYGTTKPKKTSKNFKKPGKKRKKHLTNSKSPNNGEKKGDSPL